MVLLAELRTALATAGIRSTLARTHRLVLRGSPGPCEPSGLTDPALYIDAPAGHVVATTDGVTFRLSSGAQYPAATPPATVAAISGSGGAELPDATTGACP